MREKKSLNYADAGVDVKAGYRAVELIKDKVKSTFRPEVMSDLGGFAGCFRLPSKEMEKPVLVSGTDGVGTKLKLAFQTGKHNTVGQDLVAMCVNDILVLGAEPLFFLDYFASGKLQPEIVAEVVGGIADGCILANCSLIGGETAEMPGFYSPGEYDLAGFTVGLVDQAKMINGQSIEDGDWILGLPSSGVHSNGFSLVRKILEQEKVDLNQVCPWSKQTWGERFLTPTRIYVKTIQDLLTKFEIKGMVHITGGGFIENIPRILPSDCAATIFKGSWPIQPEFDFLQKAGNVKEEDMYGTFNMGIGFMLIVKPKLGQEILDYLSDKDEAVYKIGIISQGSKNVNFQGEAE